MLAALSHHITQLEQRVDEQTREIEALRRSGVDAPWPPQCACTPDISSLRTQVKDNRARIERVAARFERFLCVASTSGCVGASGSVFESLKGFCSDDDDDTTEVRRPVNDRYQLESESRSTSGRFGETSHKLSDSIEFFRNAATSASGAASAPASDASAAGVKMAKEHATSTHARLTPTEFFSAFASKNFADMSLAAVGCERTAKLQQRAVSPTKIDDVESSKTKISCTHDVDEASQHVSKPFSVATSLLKSASAWSSQNDVIKQPPTCSAVTSPRETRRSSKSTLEQTASPPVTSSATLSVTSASTGAGAGDISLDNIRAIASENSGLRNQLVAYRKKVETMEQALTAKDIIIEDLKGLREHYLQKEREWEQRQDWIDHKMKLLKQDKRRRGETIGKLLKVIDDLKESGRLDESKVKDGRSVLSMTLQTRDMTPDERVLRVVDAVELDRVPRSSAFDCSRSDTPDSNFTNDNCNNSLRHAHLLRALALNTCSTWRHDDTDDEVRSYFAQNSATSSGRESRNNDDDWSMTSVGATNHEREFFFRPISAETSVDSDSDVSRSD